MSKALLRTLLEILFISGAIFAVMLLIVFASSSARNTKERNESVAAVIVNTPDSDVTLSGHSLKSVVLKNGDTVICFVRGAGAESVLVSCDYDNPVNAG